MRVLFAYVLAILAVLGGGYLGLRWLSEPPQATVGQPLHTSGEMSPKRKITSERSDSNVTEGTRAENQAELSGKSELPGRSAQSAVSNEAASATSLGASHDTKSEDVQSGDCRPFGVTARGELVFSFQCHELVARNGGALDSEPPPATNSTAPAVTQKGDQGAAPKFVDEENANKKPTEPAGSEANAKVESPPAGEAISGKENAKRDDKEVGVGKRNLPSSHPRGGMMMIMKAIFPRWSP